MLPCRGAYAQRLVALEADVARSEAATADVASSLDHLFSALTARTAAVLLGRLPPGMASALAGGSSDGSSGRSQLPGSHERGMEGWPSSSSSNDGGRLPGGQEHGMEGSLSSSGGWANSPPEPVCVVCAAAAAARGAGGGGQTGGQGRGVGVSGGVRSAAQQHGQGRAPIGGCLAVFAREGSYR